MKRLSCDEDAFASTFFNKLTTDAFNDDKNRETSGANNNNNNNNSKLKNRNTGNSESLKSLSAYFSQTRHRRDVNSSTLISDVVTPVESSTQITSTQDPNVLKVPPPQSPLPHPPHLPFEKHSSHVVVTKASSTTTTTTTTTTTENLTTLTQNTVSLTTNEIDHAPNNNVASQAQVTKSNGTISHPTKPFKDNKTFFLSPVKINDKDTNDKTSAPMMVGKELPTLIITSEKSNETLPSNSNSNNNSSSDNPQLVFMIDEKEGENFAESYLVPLNVDTMINNSPMSPMEVINVDLVEIDNFTTVKNNNNSTEQTSQIPLTATATAATTTTTTTTNTPQIHHGVHPLRMGEKIKNNVTNMSNETKNDPSPTVTTTTLNTVSGTYNTQNHIMTSSSKQTDVLVTEKTDRAPRNAIDFVKDNNEYEYPQRPNRGRLIVHSNPPSFYPYIFSKLIG